MPRLSAPECLGVITGVLGLALILSSAEYAILLKDRRFLCLSSVGVSGRRTSYRTGTARLFLVYMIIVVRGLCGIAMIYSFDTGNVAVLSTATLASVALCYIFPLGLEGSDQLTIVLLAALATSAIFDETKELALVFVGCQLATAYFTAGMVKLLSPVWRSRTAVTDVMGTSMYGHVRLWRLLSKHPRVSAFLSWAVIAFELLFPFGLLADEFVFFSLLLAGGLFHAANALFMGLNVFFLVFVGSYPAIYWLYWILHS